VSRRGDVPRCRARRGRDPFGRLLAPRGDAGAHVRGPRLG
jgi:hypothetical protein